MNSLDLGRMGLANLFRRKTRTILTVLGVVIGTASILVMISLGLGMNRAFEKQISEYGSLTTITIQKPYGKSDNEKSETVLDDNSLNEFKRIKNVDFAVGIKNIEAQLKSGRYGGWAQIQALDLKQLHHLDIKLKSGKLPVVDPAEVNVLMGGNVLENFRDPRSRNYDTVEIDPYNSVIEIVPYAKDNDRPKGLRVNISGITAGNDWQISNAVFIDLETYEKFEKRFNRRYKIKVDRRAKRNKSKYDNIKIGVNKVNNVDAVLKTVKDAGYEAFSLTEWLNQIKQTSGMIQGILFAVGMVSLVVAAIGIANTMIMSIYERTKEIGVMKVIGAQLKDIKRLFLFEAGSIGLMGGVVGVALSYGVSFAINTALGKGGGGDDGMGFAINSYLPLWLAGVGLLFSVLIGLVAGYYPAVRATKLSALEAIRND